MDVRLKPMPDGFGFIYGDGVDACGQSRRVNIMPPVPYWRGDIKLDKNGPHATEWVLYVDGDEIARALSLTEVDAALESFLGRAGRTETPKMFSYEKTECEKYHCTVYALTVWHFQFEFTKNHPEDCTPDCGGCCWFTVRYVRPAIDDCHALVSIPLWK
jgi:hypothetical protein